MWSTGKRKFFRQIGCTEAEIAQKERQAVITKAKPDSPLVEAIWRTATNGQPPSSPIAEAAKELLAKRTKDLQPAPHAGVIARLQQRGSALQ